MTSGIDGARRGAGRSFVSARMLRNGLALLAAVSLSLTTIAPAFAVSSSPTAPALAGLAAAPTPALESSGADAAKVSPYDVNNAGAGMMSLMSGGGDEPKSAKFEPPDTPYNGAFTRSLPVEVPPFFEITPRIKLNYNSGDNRQHARDGFSILGVGWTMSGGGLIERKSARGSLPKFDATDAFELDGNTLMDCVVEGVTRSTPSCSAGGTHTARYESYERIKRNSTLNSWEITARDGTVSTYKALGSFAPAGTEDARLRNDYRWLLQSVTDTDGNAVTYSYDCTALPTCYVSTISYGTSSIQFYWETRADTFTYATGISLGNATKRLKTIAVRTGSSLIRAYAVGYTISPDTKRSLLSTFKQHGSDATVAAGTGVITGGVSLPADTFTYWDMSSRRMGTMISDLVTANTAVEGTPSTTATEAQSKLVTNFAANDNYVFGDFNGDQKTDLLVTRQGTGSCQASYYEFRAVGWCLHHANRGAVVSDPSTLAPIGFCTDGSSWYVGDFNGDGSDDLATATTLASVTAAARAAWISSGYALTDAAVAVVLQQDGAVIGGIVTPIGPQGSGASAGLRYANQKAKMVVGDFDGDGRDDFFRGAVFLSQGSSFDKQAWAVGGTVASRTSAVFPYGSPIMLRPWRCVLHGKSSRRDRIHWQGHGRVGGAESNSVGCLSPGQSDARPISNDTSCLT